MLKVWFPGTNGTEDYGLGGTQWINDNVVITDNGKLGKCLSFNGSNSRLSTTTFNLSNEWSFCFWAKCNNASSWWMALWALGDNNDSNVTAGYFLIPTQSRSQISFNGTYSILPLPSPTAWTHYAGSWDGAKLVYYINGAQVYQNTYTTTYLQKTHLTIGGESNDSTNGGHGSVRMPFNGLLNDFRIYDHCLSPLEVKHLAQGLVLHYPLSMPGQENLLVPQISDNKWENWNANATWNSTNTREKIVGDDGKTWAHIIQNTTDGYGGYTCVPSNNQIVIDSSKRYTWSCIAKAGAKENAEIILWCHWRSTEGGANLSQNFKKFQLTSNPQRISWTLPQYTNDTYTVNRINLMMGTSGTGNNEIYFTDVKFEEGSRPTPWLPNPADTKYAALGFNNGIEYDVSGYNHNGTKYGTLTYSSDTPRYNTSAIFNGTDNCIKFPFNDFCTNGDVFTMNIWWKKTVLGSKAYETLIGCPSGFEMDTRSGSAQALSLYMATTRGGNVYSPFNMNEWYMVTLVNDGTNELYYVNGTLVNTIEKKNMPTGNYYVGAWKNETGQNFNGFMSDFRFYKTALSSSDILELYHTSASLADNGTLMASEVSEL